MKGPIEYIKEAWKIYFQKENFVFFSRIMAVLVIVSAIPSLLLNYFYSEEYLKNVDFLDTPMLVGFVILIIILFIIGLWTQSTIYMAILRMRSPEKDVFRLGYQNMGKLFLLTLILVLIVLGGLLLLIIPGFIFAVWFSFAPLLVLDKKMKFKEALNTSKSMIRGKFWKVLGRNFVFGLFTSLISFILTIVPYAGQIAVSFVAPLVMLPYYLLYRDLSNTITS